MQVLSYAVNSFFPTPPLPQQPQVLVFVNQFLGEANYSKGFARSQGAHENNVLGAAALLAGADVLVEKIEQRTVIQGLATHQAQAVAFVRERHPGHLFAIL